MRGGLCLLNRRYKKANNELVEYKPPQPKNFIISLDCVNFYECFPLHQCNFSWLSREGTENFNILNTRIDSKVGYMLRVDIDYSDSCMDAHDNFPFAPEHLILAYDLLAPMRKISVIN